MPPAAFVSRADPRFAFTSIARHFGAANNLLYDSDKREREKRISTNLPTLQCYCLIPSIKRIVFGKQGELDKSFVEKWQVFDESSKVCVIVTLKM
jgi:hypothetical protein